MKINKQYFSLLIVLVICILITGAVQAKANNYPSSTIHLVCTFPAGGGNDSITRAFARAIDEYTEVDVVVNNVVGAGGLTGTLQVINSKPDGYTVLLHDTALIAALTFQDLPFSLNDLEPLCSVYGVPTWILSHKDRGYNSIQEFFDKAKKNPGELTVGVAGPLGVQFVMANAIKGIKDLNFKIIPYEGGGPLKLALIGNKIDLGIIHSPILLEEIKAGMIDVLCTGYPLDKLLYNQLHDVTTLDEVGVPYTFGTTRGFFVPKGTPSEIKNYLRELFEKACESQVIKEYSENFGFYPTYRDSKEYMEYLDETIITYKGIKSKYIDN